MTDGPTLLADVEARWATASAQERDGMLDELRRLANSLPQGETEERERIDAVIERLEFVEAIDVPDPGQGVKA